MRHARREKGCTRARSKEVCILKINVMLRFSRQYLDQLFEKSSRRLAQEYKRGGNIKNAGRPPEERRLDTGTDPARTQRASRVLQRMIMSRGRKGSTGTLSASAD
jgi:hypothetical protein